MVESIGSLVSEKLGFVMLFSALPSAEVALQNSLQEHDTEKCQLQVRAPIQLRSPIVSAC